MSLDLTSWADHLPSAPAPDHALDLVPWAVPVFVVLIALEMLWAARSRPEVYEPRDTLVSLLLGLGSTIAGALTAGLIVAATQALYAHRLVTLPVVGPGTGPALWALWLGAFVLDDFNYYWFHRVAHRVRWFWASHVNHHSSQHYNLSTALRQSWTGFIALSFAFRIWPALLGVPPAVLLTVGSINLVYQFWIHTEAVGQLPLVIRAVFNTPAHHRVHHATNPLYLDRNYAGVLIVWDRLFGTFQAELAPDARPGLGRIRYGLVRQLGSFDVVWVAFHEWIALLRDALRAPWGDKLMVLFGPPGWSRSPDATTSETIRAAWHERHPAD